MTTITKIFKKIGIIQICIGLGLLAYGSYTNNLYSLIYVSFGVLLIISSFIYYFDD